MPEKLLEWTRRFIQSRNAILHDIKSQEETVDGFDIIVETATKKQHYLILADLHTIHEQLDKIDEKSVYIVTFNTKANLNKLIESWTVLAKHRNLCILFVNPDARADQKWAIYPATHEAYTEPGKLKAGLETLFGAVEEFIS